MLKLDETLNDIMNLNEFIDSFSIIFRNKCLVPAVDKSNCVSKSNYIKSILFSIIFCEKVYFLICSVGSYGSYEYELEKGKTCQLYQNA